MLPLFVVVVFFFALFFPYWLNGLILVYALDWTALFLEETCVVKYVPFKSQGIRTRSNLFFRSLFPGLLSLKLGNWMYIDHNGYEDIVSTQPNLTALSITSSMLSLPFFMLAFYSQDCVTEETLAVLSHLTNLTCLSMSEITLRVPCPILIITSF
jgi:hypothetical protein